MMSSCAHSVCASLTRTARSFLPQSSSLRPRTTWSRAAIFCAGATASSRSRNTRSAALCAAFSIILGFEPGVDSSERRRRMVMSSPLAPGPSSARRRRAFDAHGPRTRRGACPRRLRSLPDLGEDLRGVLAEQRRAAIDPRRRLGQLDRRADDHHRAVVARRLDLDEHPAEPHVRVGEDVGRIVHRADRHLAAEQLERPPSWCGLPSRW